LNSDFKMAQELLKEAGYDGTPIVLMHSTDVAVLSNLAPVAKSLMEKAGFKVDMQSMDWQTLVARSVKKDPPDSGGWHAFLTSSIAPDAANPIFTGFLNSACEKAPFGWPRDPEMEGLRDQFAGETDPGKQKAIADAVQARAVTMVTHIPLGQWYVRALMRKDLVGMVQALVTV
jgi:peptide/nickel transport system substrate-binding protein